MSTSPVAFWASVFLFVRYFYSSFFGYLFIYAISTVVSAAVSASVSSPFVRTIASKSIERTSSPTAPATVTVLASISSASITTSFFATVTF